MVFPFLVIEPAKTEYRSLLPGDPGPADLHPGKERGLTIHLQPLRATPSMSVLESYKSTLKTAFAAGVTMTSPAGQDL